MVHKAHQWEMYSISVDLELIHKDKSSDFYTEKRNYSDIRTKPYVSYVPTFSSSNKARQFINIVGTFSTS